MLDNGQIGEYQSVHLKPPNRQFAHSKPPDRQYVHFETLKGVWVDNRSYAELSSKKKILQSRIFRPETPLGLPKAGLRPGRTEV